MNVTLPLPISLRVRGAEGRDIELERARGTGAMHVPVKWKRKVYHPAFRGILVGPPLRDISAVGLEAPFRRVQSVRYGPVTVAGHVAHPRDSELEGICFRICDDAFDTFYELLALKDGMAGLRVVCK